MAGQFVYHRGRQLKSLQNEGICGSTEQSEVLLDVLSVKQTVQLASKADRLGFRSKWYFVRLMDIRPSDVSPSDI